MLASWLVDLYMVELSRTDDLGFAQAKYAVHGSNSSSSVDTHRRLSVVRKEYESFFVGI
jgi:hypothetical protein